MDAGEEIGRLAQQGLERQGRQLQRTRLREQQEVLGHVSGRALGGSLAGEAGLRGTRTEGELRFKDAALQRLPRLAALGPGRASGRLGWRGELAGPLDVALRFETGLAATGVPARLEGDASGRVAPGERTVALTWRVAGELLAPTTVVEAGRLEARGTASGTWPPALEATLAGTLDLRLPAGRERAELHGRLSANAWPADPLDAQAAGGSLSDRRQDPRAQPRGPQCPSVLEVPPPSGTRLARFRCGRADGGVPTRQRGRSSTREPRAGNVRRTSWSRSSEC